MITWTKYKKQNLNVGKYLVQRKDGKIHFEKYNGTGFAYNNNVVTHYSIINKVNNNESNIS